MTTPQQRIVEFNRNHTCLDRDCLFVTLLRDAQFTDEQISTVILALDETCNACRDAPDGCQCWNDE